MDNRKEVCVLDLEGNIFDVYSNLQEFAICNKEFGQKPAISKRLTKLIDGWCFKFGREFVVRYRKDIGKVGRKVKNSGRYNITKNRPCEYIEEDPLAETKKAIVEDLVITNKKIAKIEEKRANYRLGVFEETNADYQWLLNHKECLLNRLKDKWINYNTNIPTGFWDTKYYANGKVFRL